MGNDEDVPTFGLPLTELQAALRTIEPIADQTDNRIVEVRMGEDGTIGVRTGGVPGRLNSRGNVLWLRRTEGGWEVTNVVEWAT